MIEPTNGRIIWYTPFTGIEGVASDKELGLIQHDKTKPLAAIVTHVWSDRLVNLTVFDSNGIAYPRTSVTLLQDDDPKPEYGRFASWMPYQKGQAAKTEEAERRAGANAHGIGPDTANGPNPHYRPESSV